MRSTIKQKHLPLSLLAAICAFLLISCEEATRELPLLGDPVYKKVKTGSGFLTDTIYPVIPPYSFIDQEEKSVTNETFANRIYIADFFFISCPTICPKLTASMKTIYENFAGENDVRFVSYSIDPKHDTPERLYEYGKSLQIDPSRWHLVTGDKNEIYALALKGFYSPANPDKENPGNFIHSSGLMLVDRKGHLRGVYDGESDVEMAQLEKDLRILLKEI